MYIQALRPHPGGTNWRNRRQSVSLESLRCALWIPTRARRAMGSGTWHNHRLMLTENTRKLKRATFSIQVLRRIHTHPRNRIHIRERRQILAPVRLAPTRERLMARLPQLSAQMGAVKPPMIHSSQNLENHHINDVKEAVRFVFARSVMNP